MTTKNKKCRFCNGYGIIPTACLCGIRPAPEESPTLQPCNTCGGYRWTGCNECHRTGENREPPLSVWDMDADEYKTAHKE